MSVDARVEIVLSDGSSSEHPLAREATVGSSEQASIRLPSSSGLAPVHVRLEPLDDGVRITPAQGTVEVGGRPYAGGVAPHGTEIRAGSAILRVVRAEGDAKRGASPVVVLGIPAIAVALLVVLSDGSDTVEAHAPVEAPALFGEAAECPRGSGTTRHRAEEDAHAASAKEERYPFAPEDGVDAARLYRRAGKCFEAAGDAREAAEQGRRAARIEQRVEQDYRTSRFRLERSLEQRRWDAALAETRRLRALLTHRNGEYVQWLEDLDRRLEINREREAAR